MVLRWRGGAVALLVLLVGLFNRRLFAWIGP